MTEEQKQQEVSDAAPESGIKIPPAAKEAREDFVEKLDEKIEEMLDAVDEAAADKIPSIVSGEIDEIARSEAVKILIDDPKKEILEIKRKILEEYDKRIKGKTSGSLKELADEMVRDAGKESKAEVITKLRVVLDKIPEGERLTTAEVAKLDRAIKSWENMRKTHPELEELFVRIGENGDLEDEDYEKIIELINPANLAEQAKDPQKQVESTGAGLLISMMRPAQRYRLIELFIESDKKEGSVQLIEGMLSSGIITLFQGKELFKKAKDDGLMTQSDYDAEYKEKLEGTHYQTLQQSIRSAAKKADVQKHSGRYSRNIVDRFVGMPLIYTGLVAWGGVTALLNFAGSWDSDDFGQTLSNLASNPYFALGLGGMALGAEGASATIHDGRKKSTLKRYTGIGEGVVSKWIDSLLMDEDDIKVQRKRDAVRNLAETYLNAPSDMVTYLDNGGYKTIMELASLDKKEDEEDDDDEKKKKKPVVNLEKLIEKEKDGDQKELLKNLTARNGGEDRPIDTIILRVLLTGRDLEIKKPEKMEEQLKKIRKTQLPT